MPISNWKAHQALGEIILDGKLSRCLYVYFLIEGRDLDVRITSLKGTTLMSLPLPTPHSSKDTTRVKIQSILEATYVDGDIVLKCSPLLNPSDMLIP